MIRRVVAGDSNLKLNPALSLADDFEMRETKQEAAMKARPSNLIAFALFDGVPPLHKLDQKMMRRLRKLADRTGCTVEDLIRKRILQFVAGAEAESHLENKIISFPKC